MSLLYHQSEVDFQLFLCAAAGVEEKGACVGIMTGIPLYMFGSYRESGTHK
ncbi:hypothetical protein ACTQW9_02140 [Lachnospiraceae bacterium LCP19S3_B12]